MKPYTVEYLDMSTSRTRFRIPVTAANPVSNVTVLQLPDGSAPQVHFGNGDGIPILVAPLQLQTIWRGNVSYFTGT